MKPKQLQIAIPEPCHEDWNKMTPKDQGAFCGSCSKVVVDFTKMTDRELIAYFEKKKDEKTCGRFTKFQVDRTMLVHEPTPPFYLRLKNWMYGLLFSLSLPSFLKAENLLTKIKTINATDQDVTAFPRQIKGKVVDVNGGGLPFVKIEIFQNGKPTIINTTSSFDGEFSLDLKDLKNYFGLELQLSDLGFRTERIKLETKENYEITLLQSVIKIKGDVEVKQTSCDKTVFIEHLEVMGELVSVEVPKEASFPNEIKGEVWDENGKVMPFASIVVVQEGINTRFGATTDFDGFFKVDLNEIEDKSKLELKVSSIGYSTQIHALKKEGKYVFRLEIAPPIENEIMQFSCIKTPLIDPSYIKKEVPNLPQREKVQEQTSDYIVFNKISGKVVDQNGELLPFVSLYLLDNETITTTDYEGYFELDIPKNLNGKTKLGLEVLFMGNSSLEIIDLFPVEKRDSILIKVEEPPMIMGQMIVVGMVVPQHSNRLKTPPDLDAKWRREGFSSKKEYREFKKGSK